MKKTNFTHLVLNHVAKCAGSSLRLSFYSALKQHQYFIKNPIYIGMVTHGNISLHRDRQCIPAIHRGTKAFIDHSFAYFIEETFNLNLDRTYRIFTIREPISRFISHSLFFEKKHPKDLSKDEIDAFIHKFGFQTIRMLADHKHLKESIEFKFDIAQQEVKKYNFIFIQDKFQKSIDNFNIVNPFGLTLTNIENNKNSKKEDFIIDDDLRRYLEEKLDLEIKLYNTVISLDICNF